ncbi:GM12807 [Drosophila sechellia]|uniref:GM12807 n=1 Tax=Drosophila sechellia TaxID=7238 RepID=B4HZD0_DROSE|nr:GM12807 [Drosophila sechellia]
MQMEKHTILILLLLLGLVLWTDSSLAARRLRKKPKLPYPLPSAAQYPAGYAPYEPQQPVEAPVEQQAASPPGTVERQEMTKEQMPLPLNQQGLPPVLIPLPSQFRGQPMHLPPYPYSQYPVIYDQAGFIRQNYLPPYDYYPSQGYPVRGATLPREEQEQPLNPVQSPPPPQPLPLENLEPAQPSFEDIRNGSESKNSAVPDVPPPPIPSGPKRPRPAEPEPEAERKPETDN